MQFVALDKGATNLSKNVSSLRKLQEKMLFSLLGRLISVLRNILPERHADIELIDRR
jgi:hypothetical protein